MHALDRDTSALLVIDFQSRLMPAIEDAAAVVANARRLLDAAELLGVPIQILVTVGCIAAIGILMSRLPTGTHLLAVGGNAKAAALSGINTKRVLLMAYLVCAGLAAVSGLLLTAVVLPGAG